KLAGGLLTVAPEGGDDQAFSQGAACPKCGTSVPVVEPRSFSFNSPYGACRTCDGLGTQLKVDPSRVVPDASKTIEEGAIAAWGDATGTWIGGTLRALAKAYKFSLKTPWRKLPARVQKLLMHGSGDDELRFEYRTKKGSAFIHKSTFEGVLPNLARRYKDTTSDGVRRWIGSLMNPTPCPTCHGQRLRKESLAVRLE